MSKYAGTKTEENLKAAFAGESQARNKYTFYASAAKKAGYEQMAALYLETADQEKEHARCGLKNSTASERRKRIWRRRGRRELRMDRHVRADGQNR